MKPTLRLALTLAALAPGTGFAGELLISRQGSLLLAEDFDTAPTLPEKFTSGVGAWTVMDGALRGQQQPKDKHTAFRKIFLDHQDVIYQFDLKIEGDAFAQLLINYDLVHVSKAVVNLDQFAIYKLNEKSKRVQMAAEKRDQGLDPLHGDYTEKNVALDLAEHALQPGQWYRVTVELIGDKMAMQLDGLSVQGHHIGLTEKKTNFGFQAGGFEGYVHFDNIKVWQALPKKS
jgi:hypothetical protein